MSKAKKFKKHCPNCTVVVSRDALLSIEGMLHEASAAVGDDSLDWARDVLRFESVKKALAAVQPLA